MIGQTPSIEHYKALWMDQVFAGPSEKFDHEDTFDTWAAKVKAEARAELLPLIRDLVEPDSCWLDHHGGCQEHGYLSLQPGQVCPHRDAQDLLREAGLSDDH